VITHLGAFVAISALIAVIPGPDTAIATRNALVGGRRAGLYTIVGVALGLTVWTLATGAGIAALLRASEPAFVALKLIGAGYLIFLGVQALWGATRRTGPRGSGPIARRPIPPRQALRQGLVTNLGNPKIAVFFTSFLPQFVHGGTLFLALLLLGAIFCTITVAWLTIYVVAISRGASALRRPAVRRVLDRVTGVVLVALGIRLAFEHR
jgi:threonine/homoserine/homoserine lactone efflux protein